MVDLVSGAKLGIELLLELSDEPPEVEAVIWFDHLDCISEALQAFFELIEPAEVHFADIGNVLVAGDWQAAEGVAAEVVLATLDGLNDLNEAQVLHEDVMLFVDGVRKLKNLWSAISQLVIGINYSGKVRGLPCLPTGDRVQGIRECHHGAPHSIMAAFSLMFVTHGDVVWLVSRPIITPVGHCDPQRGAKLMFRQIS